MSITIALVDDDRNILTSLSVTLQAEGFITRLYSDGEAALKALIENPPDLAVLDIKMPRMDGMELLRRLREKCDLPVIFLTSKDEELDEALGLAMGADDYIAKPFSPAAAARPHPRHAAPHRAARPAAGERTRRPRPAEIVARPAGHGSGAAPGELGRQGRHPDRHRIPDPRGAGAAARAWSRSRNQLMDVAYQDDIYVDDRTIDSHIKRMRRKFRAVDGEFGAIETLYGVGYRFGEE